MVKEKNQSTSIKAVNVQNLVKKDRSLTEKILSVFPGYRGYKQKELHRETDRLIRNIVFRNMGEASERVRTLYRTAVNDFGLSRDVIRLEKLSMRSDAIAQKIRHATHGYKPLKNVLNVDNEALLRLMEFDANLAEDVKELKTLIQSLETSLSAGELAAEQLKALESAITMLDDTFNRREEVMLGLSGE